MGSDHLAHQQAGDVEGGEAMRLLFNTFLGFVALSLLLKAGLGGSLWYMAAFGVIGLWLIWEMARGCTPPEPPIERCFSCGKTAIVLISIPDTKFPRNRKLCVRCAI